MRRQRLNRLPADSVQFALDCSARRMLEGGLWQRSPSFYITSQILRRECDLDVSGRVPVERPLRASASPFHLPEFLQRTLTSQFATDPRETLTDILCSNLLKNKSFATEFARVWGAAHTALITSSNERDPGLTRANAKELSASQVLLGAPIWHSPLSAETHAKFDRIPPGFASADWGFVREWGETLRNKHHVKRADRVSMPRLTNQGLVLKSSADPVHWRVFSKLLLARLAKYALDNDDFASIASSLGSLFTSHGFDDPTLHFSQGIRRQHTRKAEPICRPDAMSVDQIAQIGESHGIQGRVRGIFMPSEFLKTYFKYHADGLKEGLFHHTRSFSVEPAALLAHFQIIDAGARSFESCVNGEQLCFSDLSGFDTTTHRGFFDVFYAFLHSAFPNDVGRLDPAIIGSSDIICPTSWGPKCDIVRVPCGGWSTLSGESFVTVKNNIVHMAAILRALGDVLGSEPMDVWARLEDPNMPDFEIHLHGDDCMRFLGSDAALYDALDARLGDFGLGVGRETAPAFLKKQLRSDRNRLHGISGSLMRNRFSEYGVSEPCVLTLGLYDTWQSLPPEDRPACRDLWRLIGSLGTSGVDPTVCDWATIERDVLPAIADLASSSVGKAREVQSLLDRMYFSSGQVLPDRLDDLYGSLSYDPDNSEHDEFGVGALSANELLRLAELCQEHLFQTNGTAPSKDDIRHYMSEISA